jgi:hypothetical protein
MGGSGTCNVFCLLSSQIKRQITYVTQSTFFNKGIQHIHLILILCFIYRLFHFVQRKMINAI